MNNPTLRGGDIIAFAGTGFVSSAIDVVTHSTLSHVGMIIDSNLRLNDAPQAELHIVESTILNGKSGPQVNSLASRINNYDKGGSIFALRLSDRIRQFLDWYAIWTFAVEKINSGDTYNKLELGKYILRKVPVIQYAPWLYAPNPHQEVCSEFVAEILRAGGLPGLHPFETPPQKLAEMAMWQPAPDLLSGRLVSIRNFNTV